MRESDEQRDYREERTDELIWERARALGMSRKRFLEVLASGAGAAAALGLGGRPAVAQAQGHAPHFNQYANWFVKPTPAEYFIDHGHAKEMRWEVMKGRGYTVSNDIFYLQNHFPVPRIDPKTYKLRVHGDAVEREVEFSLDDLKKLPSVTLTRAVECGENGRVFFAVQYKKQMDGAQWRLGGVGVAEWTGVPMRAVLERARVKPGARDVMPVGLDGGQDFRNLSARPMPLDRAMADDTLLVYGMNGQDLPPDHGGPVRTLVSGWIGPASIKWTGRVEVSSKVLISIFNTEYGVMVGPDYPPQPPFPGVVCTWQNVKSAFELPMNAVLPSGPQVVSGRSWSGKSSIRKVDVSLDGGKTWKPARLREPNIEKAWVRWDVDWTAVPGNYTFRARATDTLGQTQPDKGPPYNFHGYLYDGVVDHPVWVF